MYHPYRPAFYPPYWHQPTYAYHWPSHWPLYTANEPQAHWAGHDERVYPSQTIKDQGREPFVVNIQQMTRLNNMFRTALWTGRHLQLTLMSVRVGEEIGWEVHPRVDQFLRIEAGIGRVQMGESPDDVDYELDVYPGYAIFVPAGKWHNVINIGYQPLKLYSIYAPPEHPFGTVHETKEMALAAEGEERE